ncbi:NAD(P)H-dependent oxidoreductase [Fructilactobacillus vespulae]|uniref:NAD(P)H-dependent oxidoreductase n=1 Tax=Fructilactobacillus vespulae TaxID=1249630 RepID=UPI0039B66B8B
MKTLVIISHPEYDDSETQAFLKKAVQNFTNVTWHRLPNQQTFDPEEEQRLLMQFERIVFQFPMYWYSAPASLKQWEDDVLTRSFTFATEQARLAHKELLIVTSLGYPENDFQAGSREGFSISEMLVPYRALAYRSGMKFMSPLVISQFAYLTEAQKSQLLIKYQQYLTATDPFSFTAKQNWVIEQLQTELAKTTDKMKLQLIIDQLTENQSELAGLKEQIKLIRQEEEG